MEYEEWADHPRWKELCSICNKIDELKVQSSELRALIKKDIYGVEKWEK